MVATVAGWATIPERVSLYGTELWDQLDEEQRRTLSRHEAASLLARDACFASSVPGYATGLADPLPAIPSLYFMDPIGARDRDGRPAPADFAVDITDVLPLKRRMLEAHQSQIAWLARQHAITDFTAGMEAQGRRRGRDFGVACAEGFRQYRHPPYPRAPRLQDLLGAALRSS